MIAWFLLVCCIYLSFRCYQLQQEIIEYQRHLNALTKVSNVTKELVDRPYYYGAEEYVKASCGDKFYGDTIMNDIKFIKVD